MRDLAGHELQPAAGALVVEQDPRAREQVVALAVVDRDEVAVGLGHPVGAARVEGGGLGLRDLEHLAEHLGRGRLVEARLGHHLAHGLQHPRGAHAAELGREHRLVPRRRHERHGGQVVDLVRLAVAEHVGERALVQQVAGVERDGVAAVLQPLEGLGRGAADHAVHLVALLQQELGQVAAVLAGHARDECASGLSHARQATDPVAASMQRRLAAPAPPGGPARRAGPRRPRAARRWSAPAPGRPRAGRSCRA